MRSVQFMASNWNGLKEGVWGDEDKLNMPELYSMIQWPLQVFQTAALLEV